MTALATRAALVAAALAIGLLLPPALAEHVQSHRYLVTGRVLDADGNPVVDTVVGVGASGWRPLGYCDGWPQGWMRTDASGDFAYCLHAHDLPPRGAGVAIGVGGFEYGQPLDLELRRTTFHVKALNMTGEPPSDAWRSTYTLEGTVWQRTRAGTQEGVRVAGVALPDEPVAITLVSGGLAFEANVTTDAFGTYEARFHLPHPVTAGNVTVTARGETRELPILLDFLRGRGDVVLDGDGDHALLDAAPEPRVILEPRFPDNPPAFPPPGSTAPPFVGSGAFWGLVGLVGVAGAVAGLVLVRARRVR